MAGRKDLVCLLAVTLVGLASISCQTYSAERVEIGMTVHARGADAARIKREFDLMAAMGVTWVRLDIDWSVVESTRGQFNWAYADTVVAEAAARRMKVLAVLAYSPPWSRTSADEHSRPDQLSDFGSFARTAAKRFTPKGVRDWEIWNEPNHSQFWPPLPDATEYGRLFRAAAEAIRGVDPTVTLLVGGLAPKYDNSAGEVAPTDYLAQLYDNGTAQLADAIAVHPYSYPALPMDTRQRVVGGFKDLPALHRLMIRRGDDRKKIWITEFGAPTGTGHYAVSEQRQAAILLQARQQVKRWAWAGPLIYYELVDGGTDPADIEQNFGVLRQDLTPKAAAVALENDSS